MAEQYPNSVYCSPLLPVESLDAAMADVDCPVHRMVDMTDLPDVQFDKTQDRALIKRWIAGLKPREREIAHGLMDGHNQAEIARDLNVSQAAVSKQMIAIKRSGRRVLAPLRRSPLMV